MGSPVWKGVAAGLALFLVLSGAALFTPVRPAVLKTFGRDYAALRLEARQAVSPATSVTARGAAPRDRQSPAARLATWEKRATHFSAFGFMGWLADLWPWLAGFGVALPVLGGLIGTQMDARRAAPSSRLSPLSSSASPASSSPVSPAAVPPAEGPASEEAVPPGPEAADHPASPPVPPPTPPETWNWNARPASRTTPARPKPPPVQSPNADPL